MMLHIPGVLKSYEIACCRDVMDKAAQLDGDVAGGHESCGCQPCHPWSCPAKRSLQWAGDSTEARELGGLVVNALGKSRLFMSAVLPRTVFPPLFSRHDAGEALGDEAGHALRQISDTSIRMRCDVSATLFISEPEDYDGGELIFEGIDGAKPIKLPAGDMVVYPANSLHHVTPITRGSRLASLFWTQSMVRDMSRRALLFDLDMSIQRLTADHPDHDTVGRLTSTYHGLVRQWAEP